MGEDLAIPLKEHFLLKQGHAWTTSVEVTLTQDAVRIDFQGKKHQSGPKSDGDIQEILVRDILGSQRIASKKGKGIQTGAFGLTFKEERVSGELNDCLVKELVFRAMKDQQEENSNTGEL